MTIYTERVAWGSYVVDRRTHNQLEEVQRLLGSSIRCLQGSWSHSTLSANTHAGSGAADLAPTGSVTWRQLESACRRVGGAAWFRPWDTGWHVHHLAIGNPELADWAKVQVSAYKDGYDGLGAHARNGRDTGTRAYVDVTWERYLKAHPLPPLGEDVISKSFWRPTPQKLPNNWAYLKINDKGDVSIASGPVQVVGLTIELKIDHLPVGNYVYLRLVEDDVDGAGKVVKHNAHHNLAKIEGVATGSVITSVPAGQSLGSPGAGRTRRLRVQVFANTTGVEIGRAGIHYHKA
jgi:hypothetical protein